MDEHRALRALGEDGLELLGEITLGGAVVVGEPGLLAQVPANGAYHAAATRKGRWLLLGREATGRPDALAEVIAAHEAILPQFYDIYDEAALANEIPCGSGRILLAEALSKDDPTLLRAAWEPDLEGLPWVLDRACVLSAPIGMPVRVFQPAGDAIELVALNFGAPPRISGAPVPDR